MVINGAKRPMLLLRLGGKLRSAVRHITASPRYLLALDEPLLNVWL